MGKYLVALAVGGVMEHPEFEYHDRQVIEAPSEKEACRIYNEKNKCSYFYGKVIQVLDPGLVSDRVPL